jgi:hypothetical protein
MNVDGVYDGGDTTISNKQVNLYKKGVGESYTFIASGTTDGDGEYLFTGLSNGYYKVDFNEVKQGTEYFTIKGNNADQANSSKVEYIGVNSGTVINVDPTKTLSKTINAGVLAYNTTDLKVDLSETSAELIITTAGTNPKKQLTRTISPSYFDKIKDTSNAVQWSITNGNVVGVTNSGQIEGKSHGTGTIKVTIKDVYGNTTGATIQVTVLNRIPLSCTINYNPSGNTNQNVTATLTGCNKAVTVTNNS